MPNFCPKPQPTIAIANRAQLTIAAEGREALDKVMERRNDGLVAKTVKKNLAKRITKGYER